MDVARLPLYMVNPRMNAILPKKGSFLAAGVDLFEPHEEKIKPTERKVIDLNIGAIIPPGYYLRIADKSSVSRDHGIHVMAGVIDSDYQGAIKVVLINLGEKEVHIPEGAAITQGIVTKITNVTPEWISAPRAVTGAFGSTTGKKEPKITSGNCQKEHVTGESREYKNEGLLSLDTSSLPKAQAEHQYEDHHTHDYSTSDSD